jgi:hypothetical protein
MPMKLEPMMTTCFASLVDCRMASASAWVRGVDAGQGVARQFGQRVGRTAEGQQQLVVVQRWVIFELDFLLGQVQAGGAGVSQQLDALLLMKCRLAQGQRGRWALPAR